VGSLSTNITQAFCLPISLQEIIDSMNQRMQNSEVREVGGRGPGTYQLHMRYSMGVCVTGTPGG